MLAGGGARAGDTPLFLSAGMVALCLLTVKMLQVPRSSDLGSVLLRSALWRGPNS